MATPTDPAARAQSRAVDRLLADLHAAIRCRCCPPGALFSRHLDDVAAGEPAEDAPAAPRALSRADFLGMLQAHQVDPELGEAG